MSPYWGRRMNWLQRTRLAKLPSFNCRPEPCPPTSGQPGAPSASRGPCNYLAGGRLGHGCWEGQSR